MPRPAYVTNGMLSTTELCYLYNGGMLLAIKYVLVIVSFKTFHTHLFLNTLLTSPNLLEICLICCCCFIFLLIVLHQRFFFDV